MDKVTPKKSSIMFLVGSGISLPAGFPKTSDITSQILSGKNIIRHTDSRYYPSSSPSELENHFTNKYLPQVISLIKNIKQIMIEYDKEEEITYEILFYFIQQLDDFESGNAVNMGLHPFVKELESRMSSQYGSIRFIDLYGEAERYIRHSVWHLLNITPKTDYSYLSIFVDALNDSDFERVNVATLNHDILLEKYFTENEVMFHDGFSAPINGVRYFENKFKNNRNLLKLHGSINWFLLQLDQGSWFDQKIGIVLDGDIDHAKTLQNKLMHSQEPCPAILTGTFNKITEYTAGIHSDIYYQYKELLKKTKYLIVSGYSFGDKGINTAIVEWLFSNQENRIVIIHHNENSFLMNRARVAIRRTARMARNNFILIPKNIQETSWKEIKQKIKDSP